MTKRRGNNPKHRKKVPVRILFVLILAGIGFAVSCLYQYKERNCRGNTEFSADEPSESTVEAAPDQIPEYSGTDQILLNENKPNFTEYDFQNRTGEMYSNLDVLGRCGTAMVILDRSMMPQEERGEIGHVTPSGWNQAKYPGVVDSQPPYLYNRCHLVAYAMTGQNDNERNLITGTRYLNKELMLPYEIQILQYLDHSDHHVLYRVTPYFHGLELVARGVELEACSVEDRGEGVQFHVFLYNVQPGIRIDYLTGVSQEDE